MKSYIINVRLQATCDGDLTPAQVGEYLMKMLAEAGIEVDSLSAIPEKEVEASDE